MKTKRRSSGLSFLHTIAGFKPAILKECKIDQYHAGIIGLLLLFVGLYATLAWTFFFQTVTDSIFFALLGGLFLGAFIVSLDRALIASLARGKGTIWSLGFRLLLALLLGIFLSQPMILKLYEPEIQREAQLLMDEKALERKAELEKLYTVSINNAEARKNKAEKRLSKTKDDLLKAEQDFTKEMDGSGGTGQWGYSVVAKQKESIVKQHRAEYNKLNTRLPQQIDLAQAEIDSLNKRVDTDMLAYSTNNKQAGTLIQVAALQALLSKDESGALRERYYLLSVILILIELSALIAKLLFKMEGYKGKVQLIEEFEGRELAVQRRLNGKKLEHYEVLASRSDHQNLERFFKQVDESNREKVIHVVDEWKKDKEGTLKSYWNRLKDKVMMG